MSKIYKICVSWTETGSVPIEADNLNSAIAEAKRTMDDIRLPEGEYLDNSFSIDEETTRLLDNIFKKPEVQKSNPIFPVYDEGHVYESL